MRTKAGRTRPDPVIPFAPSPAEGYGPAWEWESSAKPIALSLDDATELARHGAITREQFGAACRRDGLTDGHARWLWSEATGERG